MNRMHKKSGRIYEVLPLSIFEVMTCSIISLFELKIHFGEAEVSLWNSYYRYSMMNNNVIIRREQ